MVAAAVLAGPVQPETACNDGAAAFRRGDLPAAQVLLWSCIESGRGTGMDTVYLAQTFKELKNYHTGLAQVEPLLKKQPDNVELLYLGAFLHYRRDDTRQAMALTARAYRIAPGDWRVHQIFALNYIRFNMLELAKLSLQQAIALNSANAELHYQLGRLYFTLGSYVESIAATRKALEIFPDYPEAHHNLALSYEGNGDVDAAIRSFETAIALNEKFGRKDEWPVIDYAVYERMRGNPESAVRLLEQALAINPRSTRANYQMGELLRGFKRYGDAKQFLETALDLDPCNDKAVYGLAMVCRVLGNTSRAAALLERFRQLNPKLARAGEQAKGCEAAN